jgi:hypothetical protein
MMAIVVDFIRRLAPWVYGACALAALWYLRVVILARRERRYAVFTLEREAALNRVYGAWMGAIALVLVMGIVYLLSTVVSDAVQPLVQEGQPTPTPTGFALIGAPSITPTLPLPDTTPTSTPTKRPRPTARPQPTPAPQETPTPAVVRPRCPDPRSVITAPGINAQVSGMVPILGAATHENFQFYKLEYGAGTDPSVWSYFDGGDRPVAGGQLGTLNAGALAPGAYSIRIVVVDSSGNFPSPCQTTIVIR